MNLRLVLLCYILAFVTKLRFCILRLIRFCVKFKQRTMSERNRRKRKSRRRSRDDRQGRYRDHSTDGNLRRDLKEMFARVRSIESLVTARCTPSTPMVSSDVGHVPSHVSRHHGPIECSVTSVDGVAEPMRRDQRAMTPSPSRLNRDTRSVPNVDVLSQISVPSTFTDRIVDAIRSINTTSSLKPNCYISSFDPNLHNIDDWCVEVERAKSLYNWDDYECLSRIGNCFKGEARSWLDKWVTTERTWENFKREFKPLCPKVPDVANILFEVMNKNSDNYVSYADYARQSLLRLRIVRGLSDELITAIVIRGIVDPQVKACATNAKLTPNDLVDFFSNYVKTATSKFNSTPIKASSSYHSKNALRHGNPRKRHFDSGKCFSCGRSGHNQADCKKFKRGSGEYRSLQDDSSLKPVFVPTKPDTCAFCKKSGHVTERCFAKLKSESRNKNNVNFCRKQQTTSGRDVIVAVIQGVPVDVLIDSGSTISLISAHLLRHFNCARRPTFRILKGLGSQEIECTSYVTLLIEFDGLSLDVDLYIVDTEYMNTPIIVGTDILNRKGVSYIRTCDKQILTSDFNVNRVITSQSNAVISVKTPLVGNELQRLMTIIEEFSKFLISGTATTTVNTGSMNIRLNSDIPVNYRPYRLSYAETLRVRDIIADLLKTGIIRESESEYASPILLVKKKDGSDRMCVDFRKLNSVTIKDRFPLPRIDDHIDRLGRSKYFTCLDMATGFHQIPLEKDSMHLTGFVTPEGHYEYMKMPYGLANAPVVYQRIIAKTLKKFIETGDILVYIDDILILSKTIDRGLTLLREVLSTLTNAGFSINLKKCSFLSTSIEYLGRNISEGQVRPSSEKVRALTETGEPTNVKQVRQFMGLASYFRRYIPNFAQKTACIASLTRKDIKFNWGSEHKAARKIIIDCLTSEPVLAIYDPSLPIEIHTDASSIGYGGVFLQVHEGGHKRVVAYFSKLTQGAEGKYHSYELETLAVVKVLQHFRHYLVGVHFIVVTDCNALKLTQRKKDLLPRVARWWVYLQDFDFDLEYRKGTQMSHADYLSRNPVNVCTVKKPLNWAQIAQASDEETRALIQKLNDGQLDSSSYIIKNDTLYYKYTPSGESSRYLCYIPRGHRLSLLRVFHDEHDHPGIDKTVDLLLKHFWFPGLRAFVRKYILHCIVCISHKKVQRDPLQPIHSWEKPEIPFETIHMDVLGPLPEIDGYRYILIVIDAFSKFCLLYTMYRQDSDELKRHITNVISLFGAPKLIVADRGRMFQSVSFLDWVKNMGTDVHLITPEMHQSNGQVERYCRTVLDMIRIEANHCQQKWPSVVWKLQLVLNITRHRTTQHSALNLLVGIDAATPLIRSLVRDVALEGSSPNREALRVLTRQHASEKLRQNQLNQDSYVNQGRRPARSFEVNSLVFVKKQAQSMGKLDSGMRGPYRVMKILPHGRYELKLLAGSYGKLTQAAAEYMIPWRGEWTPEVCAACFEGKSALVRAADRA